MGPAHIRVDAAFESCLPCQDVMTTKLTDINDNDFVIFDAKELAPYIARGFPSRRIALTEKQILLEGFPENSPWRERLTVRRKQGDIYV